MSSTKEAGTSSVDSRHEWDTPPRKRLCVSPTGSCVRWKEEGVCRFFSSKGLPDAGQIMQEQGVTGSELYFLSQEDLEQMEISPSQQDEVLAAIQALKQPAVSDVKVFNDSVHGHIELHPLMVKIIDTPQFQRLRHIKQLGGTYFVYPGGSHNRFEHSLGVAHLAGELVSIIRQKQPELGVTDEDVLCVRIAGLCHDLGHGPFSHLFDGMFIPHVRPGKEWKHEMASVDMFDYLIDDNDLEEEFHRYGLVGKDIHFIKEQIAGPQESENISQTQGVWPYVGRSEEKSFLYEIVANKKNGIDVDKWDYFARDCQHLGISTNFDHKRYMAFVRVLEVNSRRHICSRDKEVNNLYDMFYIRKTLHQRAYQHKTGNAIEFMLRDIMTLANDHVRIPGCDGELVPIAECVDDMVAYTKLNDSVIQLIKVSSDPSLKEAQDLIARLERRQLYKHIGQTAPIDIQHHSYLKSDSEKLASEILAASEKDLGGLLVPEDLLVHVVTFDYGLHGENPIDHMRFYSKHYPDVPVKLKKEQVSHMLPRSFSEQHIRVYCKRLDPKCYNAAWKCFRKWCEGKEFGIEADKDDECEFGVTPYATPFGTPASAAKMNSTYPQTPPLLKESRQKIAKNLFE